MNPEGFATKIDYAGEDQQQFTRPKNAKGVVSRQLMTCCEMLVSRQRPKHENRRFTIVKNRNRATT
jgi:hypothetical protein